MLYIKYLSPILSVPITSKHVHRELDLLYYVMLVGKHILPLFLNQKFTLVRFDTFYKLEVVFRLKIFGI